MRAVLVREHGGPRVLRVADVPDPLPGPGELLIAVEAAGVNFIDIYRRSGVYPGVLPFVPGVEAAGTVLAAGEGAEDGPRPGERVAWANQPGGYAERAVVPAHRVVRVPEALTSRDAAAVLLQGMTAHYLTHETYPVRPGDTVLVHAAAGGMGLLLTRFVHLRGGRVIGTVSSTEKEQAARAAGAWQVLRRDGGSAGDAGVDGDLAATVRELTDGEGVAAVYDGVGAPTFDTSLSVLRPCGTLALFGQAGGAVPPVDPQRLNTAGSVFLTRPNLDHHIRTTQQLTARAEALFRYVADGRCPVHAGGSHPLERAAEAHRALESRSTTGKLLLTTEPPDPAGT
ncbi:quinone oxidoreductase [Streptomyces sp. WMMB303]|uniref:quinone oxidoreductase family protein n=1 Tax=Streptomyces sp. WMMB303 TaxID=3034154 RepID=UPI0023ED038E|nr:quinone oxidoreductase [Streptomyces sp. WMMB303]MDF4251739.1 quinone oxidoreductase [Streptomyces sp. WMMB303]